MNKVTINGVVVSGDLVGRSIIVKNNSLFVDGKEMDLPDTKIIHVEVIGDVDVVHTVSGNAYVSGSSKEVRSVSGDISTKDVNGNVESVSGDINIQGSVSGSIRTVSGGISK